MATNTVTTGFLLPAIAWGYQNSAGGSIFDSYLKSISDKKLSSLNGYSEAINNFGGKQFFNNGNKTLTSANIRINDAAEIQYSGKHSFEIIMTVSLSDVASSPRFFVNLKNNSDEYKIKFSNDKGFVIVKNGSEVSLDVTGSNQNIGDYTTLKVRVFFWNNGTNDKITFEMFSSAFQGEIPNYTENGIKNIENIIISSNSGSISSDNLTIWDIDDEISSGKNLKDNIGTSNDFQKQRFEFPFAQKSDDPNNQNVRYWEASATDWTPTPSGSSVFDVLTDGDPNTFAEVASVKTGLEQTNVDASAISFNADGTAFLFSKIVGVRQVAARVADDDAEQVNFQIQAPTAKQTDGTTAHTIQTEQTDTLTAPIGQSGFMAKTWDFSSEPIDASLSDLRGSMSK